jgi:hypothetical protein
MRRGHPSQFAVQSLDQKYPGFVRRDHALGPRVLSACPAKVNHVCQFIESRMHHHSPTVPGPSFTIRLYRHPVGLMRG